MAAQCPGNSTTCPDNPPVSAASRSKMGQTCMYHREHTGTCAYAMDVHVRVLHSSIRTVVCSCMARQTGMLHLLVDA